MTTNTPAGAKWALRLLGGFELRGAEGSVALGARSAELVLAYLALQRGRMLDREAVAATLWPDADGASGRGALRQALWRVGAALGEATIVRDKQRVGLADGAPLDVDVHLLEGARDDDVAALDAALLAYRGPLLPTVDAQWAVTERERLQARLDRVAQALLDQLERHHRWDAVVPAAEAWIATGHVPEPAYRALMRARHAAGDRAGIATVLERCRAALAAELGVTPSRETELLAANLVRPVTGTSVETTGATATTTPVVERGARLAAVAETTIDRTDSTGVSAETPFVGREVELATLHAAVDRARQGRGTLRVVMGEAGAGKSWLLRELATGVARAASDRESVRGHPVTVVRASGVQYVGRGTPYLVLPPLLAPLDPAALPSSLRALRDPGKAPSAEPPPVGRVAAELAEAWRAQASRAPALVVVDDLQWVDSSSLAVLLALARAAADTAIALVVAYRPEPVDDGPRPGPSEVIEELIRLADGAVVDLDRADGAAFVSALVRATTGRDDAGLTADLLAIGGGHALVTDALLQARGDGALVRQGESSSPSAGQDAPSEPATAAGVASPSLPQRATSLVRARLAAQPAAVRRALLAAAVVGPAFTAETVAEVTGIPVAHVTQALLNDAVHGARLVVGEGRVGSGDRRQTRFRFRHGWFAQAILADLDDADRTLLHEAVADALERGGIADDDAAAHLQVARHRDGAGDAAAAARARVAAARAALRFGGYPEASSHAQAVLDRIALGQVALEGSETLERDATWVLAEATQATEGYASHRAAGLYRRVVHLAQRSGAHEAGFVARWNLWASTMQRGDVAAAVRHVAELERAALDDDDRLQAQHAGWFTWLARGDVEGAMTSALLGARLGGTLRLRRTHLAYGGHDPIVCAHAHVARSAALRAEAEAAVQHAREAAVQARALGHGATLAQGLTFAAEAMALVGEADEAMVLANEALLVARASGLAHWVAYATIMAGMAHAAADDWPAAGEAFHAGVEAYRGIGGVLELPTFLTRLAEARLRAGSAGGVTTLLDEADQRATSTGELRWKAETMRVRALLADAHSDVARASALRAEATAVASAQGAALFVSRCREDDQAV